MITSSLTRRSSSAARIDAVAEPSEGAQDLGPQSHRLEHLDGGWPRSHRPRLSSNDGSSLTASKAVRICSGVTVTRTDASSSGQRTFG